MFKNIEIVLSYIKRADVILGSECSVFFLGKTIAAIFDCKRKAGERKKLTRRLYYMLL